MSTIEFDIDVREVKTIGGNVVGYQADGYCDDENGTTHWTSHNNGETATEARERAKAALSLMVGEEPERVLLAEIDTLRKENAALRSQALAPRIEREPAPVVVNAPTRLGAMYVGAALITYVLIGIAIVNISKGF